MENDFLVKMRQASRQAQAKQKDCTEALQLHDTDGAKPSVPSKADKKGGAYTLMAVFLLCAVLCVGFLHAYMFESSMHALYLCFVILTFLACYVCAVVLPIAACKAFTNLQDPDEDCREADALRVDNDEPMIGA